MVQIRKKSLESVVIIGEKRAWDGQYTRIDNTHKSAFIHNDF